MLIHELVLKEWKFKDPVYMGHNRKAMLSFEIYFSHYEKWYIKHKPKETSWFDGPLNDCKRFILLYNRRYQKKKTNWKIRKQWKSRENRVDIISITCIRCWQPIRKRGYKITYRNKVVYWSALAFSEDNRREKAKQNIIIENGFAKGFKRVLQKFWRYFVIRTKIVSL